MGKDAIPLGGAFQVNTVTTDNQLYAKVTSLPDGYVITWVTDVDDIGGGTAHAQLYATDGTPIGDEIFRH